MDRRKFLFTSGAAAGLAVLAPNCAPAARGVSIPGTPVDRIKPISPEERLARQEQARKLMAEQQLDVILIEGGSSMHYFTGASWGRSERLFAFFLPQKGEAFYIAPQFEEARAKEQVGTAKLYTWSEDESPYELIAKLFKEKGWLTGNLGIEESTRYFVTENIQQTLSSIQLRSATSITAGCRSIKSIHEITIMELANQFTAEVFSASVKQLREGMTEAEYGKIISGEFAKAGVSGGALVLFGEASAYPHGLKKENKLKPGDIVLMDGGCTVEGYESDVTRTTVYGKASDKMKSVWDIVHQAQAAGLKAARPGVTAESVDAAARQVITGKGYGPGFRFFTHRLGHGIGLDGHEWFYLVGGNKRLLQTGNMFSNEPGIYIPGEFGIRLEDEMLITQDGARLLLPPQESLELV
jgi:Xaa-Pro dipeptidase